MDCIVFYTTSSMTTDKTFVRIVFKNTVLTEVFFMVENTGDTGSEFKLSYGGS